MKKQVLFILLAGLLTIGLHAQNRRGNGNSYDNNRTKKEYYGKNHNRFDVRVNHNNRRAAIRWEVEKQQDMIRVARKMARMDGFVSPRERRYIRQLERNLYNLQGYNPNRRFR